MPPKHSIKRYQKEGYYHLFNRGVEKRKIFQDQEDYHVFLAYLKAYLEPKNVVQLQQQLANPETNWQEKGKIVQALGLKNFAEEIQLLAYCLMPNHFHLLVKQKAAKSIEFFMKSLATRYALYFNKKNKRVGPLFQGIYKAVLINTDEQLLHLSRYIHLNPAKHLSSRINLEDCYSSYKDYLGKRKTTWVKPQQILTFFSKTNPKFSYQTFVEASKTGESEFLSRLILE